jgi:hypothetical protein
VGYTGADNKHDLEFARELATIAARNRIAKPDEPPGAPKGAATKTGDESQMKTSSDSTMSSPPTPGQDGESSDWLQAKRRIWGAGDVTLDDSHLESMLKDNPQKSSQRPAGVRWLTSSRGASKKSQPEEK